MHVGAVMLHWLAVSKPPPQSLAPRRDRSVAPGGIKLPLLPSKAKKEWNSRLEAAQPPRPVTEAKHAHGVGHGGGVDAGAGAAKKLGVDGSGKPPKRIVLKPSAPTDTLVDAVSDRAVTALERQIKDLRRKHNAMKKLQQELAFELSNRRDKCTILRRENQSARTFRDFTDTLKQIERECSEQSVGLRFYDFSEEHDLTPVVSLLSVGGSQSQSDVTGHDYVRRLENALKRVTFGIQSVDSRYYTFRHMLSRLEHQSREVLATSNAKRAEVMAAEKDLEKLKRKVLQARHLRQKAFDNKCSFEQYVENNRKIWLKKLGSRKHFVSKVREELRLKKAQDAKQAGSPDKGADGRSSGADAMARYYVNKTSEDHIKGQFQKLSKYTGVSDINVLVERFCQANSTKANLQSNMESLRQKLEGLNTMHEQHKLEVTHLQIHGGSDHSGAYREIEKMQDALDSKMLKMRSFMDRRRRTERIEVSCNEFFNKIVAQLQQIKAEWAPMGDSEESVPDVVRAMQISELKLEALKQKMNEDPQSGAGDATAHPHGGDADRPMDMSRRDSNPEIKRHSVFGTMNRRKSRAYESAEASQLSQSLKGDAGKEEPKELDPKAATDSYLQKKLAAKQRRQERER